MLSDQQPPDTPKASVFSAAGISVVHVEGTGFPSTATHEGHISAWLSRRPGLVFPTRERGLQRPLKKDSGLPADEDGLAAHMLARRFNEGRTQTSELGLSSPSQRGIIIATAHPTKVENITHARALILCCMPLDMFPRVSAPHTHTHTHPYVHSQGILQ